MSINQKGVFIVKLLKSYLLYTLSAFGISLTVKANIGVSCFNSMNLALAEALSIKIGTITIFFNTAFLIIYMILTQFHYKKKYLIQALSFCLFGLLINFFTYYLLRHLIPTIYFHKIVLLLVGTSIGGFAIGGIIHYNQITFPLESVCVQLSKRYPLSFVQLRYMADVLFVLVSLILSLSNGLPLFVREGTIISMLLLSLVMNTSKQFFRIKEDS